MNYQSAFKLLLAIATTVHLGGVALAVSISIAPDGSVGTSYDILPLGPGLFGFGDTTFQQITNFSSFSALTGPMLLTSIDFINGNAATLGQLMGATIQAGVTPVNAGFLTNNLSSNAPNPLTLVASNYTPTTVAGVFDVHIDFAVPFLYNPSVGNNLILQFFTPDSTGVVGVNYVNSSSVTGGAFSSANVGDFAQNGEARLIQYNFVDPAAPELDSLHSLPAFLFVGLFCLAGQRGRRRQESATSSS